MKVDSSILAFQDLCSLIPGGVNSPFRSFDEVGGGQLIFSHGKGARIYDIEGRGYLDYQGAWGPLILGHCRPEVVEAALEAIREGCILGGSTLWEARLARKIQQALPSVEMNRFVNSGAEAVESAIRLSRGYTGREKILRCVGGYHGHVDSTIWEVGPESSDPDPVKAGIPASLASLTLTVPFNDVNGLKEAFRKHRGEIACFILEPVTGSMGVIPPTPGYLDEARRLTEQDKSLLIFDEVLTGFRVAYGGAQILYGVIPDLTCLGKALGGGFPIGCYGGRREIMQQVAPLGQVYQAGTFSGNPVSMRAGLATLEILDNPALYQDLERKSQALVEGIMRGGKLAGIRIQGQRVGSLFSLLFVDQPVRNFEDSKRINQKQFSLFFHGMLRRGILFPPSWVDAAVVSAAHTMSEIEETIQAAEEVLREIRGRVQE